MAVYSGRLLAEKLGIKPGCRLWAKQPPAKYSKLLATRSSEVTILTRPGKDLDLVHLFTLSCKQLAADLRQALGAIKQNGAIWVSWPKRTSRVATDLTEGAVRDLALPLGWVDIKVCVVDDTWSSLKLVIRKQYRKP